MVMSLRLCAYRLQSFPRKSYHNEGGRNRHVVTGGEDLSRHVVTRSVAGCVSDGFPGRAVRPLYAFRDLTEKQLRREV